MNSVLKIFQELTGLQTPAEQLKTLREEFKKINSEIERIESGEQATPGLPKWLDNLLGNTGAILEKLKQDRKRIVEEIKKLEKELSEETGKIQPKTTPGPFEAEIKRQQQIARIIAQLRLRELVAGAANEFEARMIALDQRYAMEQERFRKHTEVLKQLEETYQAERAALREKIIANNLEILKKRVEAEEAAMIEIAEAEKQSLEERQQNYESIAIQIGSVLAGPMTDWVEIFLSSTKRASKDFQAFINDLLAQIRRFMAAEIVKGFLNLVAGAFGFGPVFGGIFSKIFGAQQGAFIKGTPEGRIIRVGEGNTDEVVIPLKRLSLPTLSPPPLPQAPGMTGGVSQISERVVNNNIPVGGEIVVRAIAPEDLEIVDYHIKIGREIIRPDFDKMDQFNRTKDSEFD